jgi:ATP-dependent DNA helicase RecG
MNPEDVRYLVQQGEGDRLEFKEQRTLARDLAKVFVAFANHQGGTVLVGVTDDGQIAGVQDWPALEGKIRNATLNNCRPAVQVQVERVETPEGTVVVVRVPEGMEKPYRAGNIYYVRDGLHSRGATPLELTQMLYQSGRFAYDQTPVPEARFEDLDQERIERYVLLRRRSPRLAGNSRSPQGFLQAMGLLVEDATPTIAAVLLFAPYPQRFLPQATLNAFRFRGHEVDNRRIVDRERIEGTVEEIVEGGAAFVHRNARTLALMEGVYRHDLPEYPEGAIREVFTNAVMHRDYRSPEWITLRMFDDRLEVENPGGLVGVLSIEELLARPRSYPRNGLLLRVAQDLGLVELVASGIQRIITEVRESGSDVDPVFWADAGRFTVTLPSLWWQMEGTEEI